MHSGRGTPLTLTPYIGIHWAGVGSVGEGNVQLGVEVFSLPPFHLQIRQV